MEFEFMTSPLEVPPLESADDKDGGSGWWFSRPDDYFKAQDESDCVKGFEVWREKPFENQYGP